MRVRGRVPRRGAVCAVAVVAVGLGAAGCSGGDSLALGSSLRASAHGGDAQPSATPTSGASTAPTRPAPRSTAVAPLTHRLAPDLLITSTSSLTAAQVAAVRAVPGVEGVAVLDVGVVQIYGGQIPVLGIDPSEFRAFAPEGTAENDGVWQAIARGDAVMAHADAQRFNIPLGGTVQVVNPNAGPRKPAIALRIGAFATTIPGGDLLVSHSRAADLGLVPTSGLVISTTKDPTATAAAVRRIVGDAPTIDLLEQPAANPSAYLTGASAAKAFGAFSYRYFPDGTIEPDAAWVRANIRTRTVPILGQVTCHRLMFNQLVHALDDVVAAGLASEIKPSEYGGCYVPRFIERNPAHAISLHTWGIAIDLNVAENPQHTHGSMDPRIVAIFKRWGFRWGGDWSDPDPMHFELGALLTS